MVATTVDVTERVDEVLAQLRSNGGRVTSSRRAILHALFEHAHHPTAEQLTASVQARFPDIHESTVYRFLDDLKHLGVVDQVNLGRGPAVYHLAEDTHHHLVCQSCARVIEVPDEALDEFRRQLRRSYAFELEPQHFALLGRCEECASSSD